MHPASAGVLGERSLLFYFVPFPCLWIWRALHLSSGWKLAIARRRIARRTIPRGRGHADRAPACRQRIALIGAPETEDWEALPVDRWIRGARARPSNPRRGARREDADQVAKWNRATTTGTTYSQVHRVPLALFLREQ